MNCVIEDCPNKGDAAKGLCWKHYRRSLRHNDPLAYYAAPKLKSTDSTRECAACKEMLPFELFAVNTNRADNLHTYCRTCDRLLYQSKSHNIPIEKLKALIEKQNGCCAICNLRVEKLVVDHDHACCPAKVNNKGPDTCGECIRGLLCKDCNTGIGFLHDNRVILNQAILYLDKYDASQSVRQGLA